MGVELISAPPTEPGAAPPFNVQGDLHGLGQVEGTSWACALQGEGMAWGQAQ